MLAGDATVEVDERLHGGVVGRRRRRRDHGIALQHDVRAEVGPGDIEGQSGLAAQVAHLGPRLGGREADRVAVDEERHVRHLGPAVVLQRDRDTVAGAGGELEGLGRCPPAATLAATPQAPNSRSRMNLRIAGALQLSWSSPKAVTPSNVHSVRQLTVNRFGLIENAELVEAPALGVQLAAELVDAVDAAPASGSPVSASRSTTSRVADAQLRPLAVAEQVAVDRLAARAEVHRDRVEGVARRRGGVAVAAVARARAASSPDRTGTAGPTSGRGSRTSRPGSPRRAARSCPGSGRAGRGATRRGSAAA